MVKIIIIGAGVVGSSVARELSRYKADITVLEKCFDVSEGTSKANSGIVHAGHDAANGTLKAKFNCLGNAMFDKLSEELDFPFKRNGAFVLCFDSQCKEEIYNLYQNGIKNGVKDLQILDGESARKIEPNLSPDAIYALFAPSSGIVSPYEMTLAYAQNAHKNGVKFFMGIQAVDIVQRQKDFEIICNNGERHTADIIINCAGLFADEINNIINEKKFEITARRGEYVLMDKVCKGLIHSTIFQLPTKMGKGVLVTPTTHGNILVGPTAYDIEDKSDVDTTPQGLSEVYHKGKISVPVLNKRYIITQFSGNRARETSERDFIIGWAKEGFYNIAGIDSPGLSAAPAIAVYAAEQISKEYALSINKSFDPIRKDIPHLNEMKEEERAALIAKNPLYAKIVCRCENVSEGEIVDSIRTPLGAKDLDGVKRRTRAGMGRCQSGFCSPRVAEILSRELNIPLTEITKDSNKSTLLIGG